MPAPSPQAQLKQLKNSLQAIEKELAQIASGSAAGAHLESRMRAIGNELDETSQKVIAYKLKRLAESKTVEKVHQQTTAKPKYQSSTFQCQSDLNQCLADSSNALQKAICYALFIRCAVKG